MLTHYVQKNETMDAIATKYGFPHGGVIFHAPCNRQLKTFRNQPAALKAGDAVNIPANAVAEAQKKVNSLRKIKEDYLGMNEKILSEWNGEVSKIKNTASQVDVAAKVLLIFKDLGFLINDGFKAMKLSGDLLEKANEKLAHSAIEFGYAPIKDAIKESGAEIASKEQVGDGVALSLGKKAIHFYFVDMQTPSFWASVYTHVNIDDTNRKVVAEIEKQSTSVVHDLDEKIAKAQWKLQQLKKIHHGHVAAHY